MLKMWIMFQTLFSIEILVFMAIDMNPQAGVLTISTTDDEHVTLL